MAVLDIDLSLERPDFVLRVRETIALPSVTALFGPSGGGKSTLLTTIAGLEPTARGRIVLDGLVLQDDARGIDVPAHRRGVGLVFQDARLFPHLSAAGNLRFAERRSCHAGGTIDLAGVVRALDLEPLLARRPSGLSGGERQRVALGRALLTRPRLLLLDEPLAGLDHARKAEILPYLEKLPAAFGIPVIHVTHDVDEAARLASHMVVLAGGRIVDSGPITDVLERIDLRPNADRWEAGALLTACVAGHDEAYGLTLLDHHGQQISIPFAGLALGADVRIRVRARDVALAVERPRGISIRNVLAGVIVELTEDPDSAYADAVIDVSGARLRAQITRAAAAELGLRVGTPALALVKSVALDRDSVTVLSAGTPNAGGR